MHAKFLTPDFAEFSNFLKIHIWGQIFDFFISSLNYRKTLLEGSLEYQIACKYKKILRLGGPVNFYILLQLVILLFKYFQVLDEFSIPEAYLFSSVRQLFTDQDWVFDPILIFNAIKQAIGDVHIKQDLYREIVNNIDQGLKMQVKISQLKNISFFLKNRHFVYLNTALLV